MKPWYKSKTILGIMGMLLTTVLIILFPQHSKPLEVLRSFLSQSTKEEFKQTLDRKEILTKILQIKRRT